MAERKRGLGRGIGSLIPDVINEDRPVDVFFPQSKKNVSRETCLLYTSPSPRD